MQKLPSRPTGALLWSRLLSATVKSEFVLTWGNWLKQLSRGGEWYLEKRGYRKILARSRNLGNVFDKSRSLVFSWFVFTFFESRNFSPKSLGLGFLTRISASRRVSDFTIRHPFKSTHLGGRRSKIAGAMVFSKLDAPNGLLFGKYLCAQTVQGWRLSSLPVAVSVSAGCRSALHLLQ